MNILYGILNNLISYHSIKNLQKTFYFETKDCIKKFDGNFIILNKIYFKNGLDLLSLDKYDVIHNFIIDELRENYFILKRKK